MTHPFGRWPLDRTPPPPPAFDPWSELQLQDEPAAGLLEAGLASLDRALTWSGRDREAGFILLEADGYLTYACEAATETPRAEELLLEILERIGSRSR